MPRQTKTRNNLRYRKTEAFSVPYELDVTHNGTYLAVPRVDLELLGFVTPTKNYLSRETKRSFKGNVIYLTGGDIYVFLSFYKSSRHSRPEIVEREVSNIARLHYLHEPIPVREPPVVEVIPYRVSKHKSTCMTVQVYNPYFQSVTDFLFHVIIHWLVSEHPVQGPKLLETSLSFLKPWLSYKVKALRGSFYDDKTRLMWAYTLRSAFPVCPVCGCEYGRLRNIHLSATYPAYQPRCSAKCAYMAKDTTERREATTVLRYGTCKAGASKEVRRRIEESSLARYGVRTPLESPGVRLKIRETCLQRYGVDAPLKNNSIREKTVATVNRLYGVSNSLLIPGVRDSIRNTLLKRYGVSNPLQNKDILEKQRKTCLERYGVDHISKVPEIMDRLISTRIKNQRLENKPKEDGFVFDSGWELKFYKYCKMRGFEITYHPCCLTYEFECRTRRYYPDFRVNGRLYEIKGDCFMNKDGTWRTPFRKKGMSGEEYRRSCSQAEAKRRCAVDNGVVVVGRIELDDLDKLFGPQR